MATPIFPVSGGCLCGKTRYQLTSSPLIIHCCHCTDCQRETGSAFAINSQIEADRIVLVEGATKPTQMPTKSGKGQIVSRCSDCHVTLWSTFGGMGDKIRVLRMGTLDEPQYFPPDLQIYIRSKLPWVILPSNMPAYEGYYDREKVWTPENCERRRLLDESLRDDK